MSNQHTSNHNDAFTFGGALRQNHKFEEVVSDRNLRIDNVVLTPVPWKQYHRVNIPHLVRHSRQTD